jgi:hypothetical protein
VVFKNGNLKIYPDVAWLKIIKCERMLSAVYYSCSLMNSVKNYIPNQIILAKKGFGKTQCKDSDVNEEKIFS